eukprot:scaffold9499_cov67-Isochrysis_galbana.AAC.1
MPGKGTGIDAAPDGSAPGKGTGIDAAPIEMSVVRWKRPKEGGAATVLLLKEAGVGRWRG